MKRLLLLIMLITAYNSVFAAIQQTNWRWRNDDGSETTATWMAEENEFITLSSAQTIRLRIEFYSDHDDPILDLFNLQYSTDNVTWTAITNTSTSGAFIVGASPFVANNDATTKQLEGFAEGQDNTFQSGRIRESAGDFSYEIAVDGITEHEWVLTPTTNLQPNTTYYFRIGSVDKGNAPLPELRTAATLPVNLSKFVAHADGKRVKLQWSTASEQNNERFDVERSLDGINWKVIGKVKGNGNSTRESNYVSYDENPSNQTNYYRLSQYDFDGKVKKSGVKMVKMNSGNLSAVAVFPNPTHEGVKFALSNFGGKSFTAMLTTLGGQTVHKQTMAVSPDFNNYYQLNVKRSLVKGNYVLRVIGENLDEATKVIVQ